MELRDENYETKRVIGKGGIQRGYWVFEVDESSDLGSTFFFAKDEAEAYIESTENKCYLLEIEPMSHDAWQVDAIPHT